jgi:hypothetical protein
MPWLLKNKISGDGSPLMKAEGAVVPAYSAYARSEGRGVTAGLAFYSYQNLVQYPSLQCCQPFIVSSG